MTPTHLIILIIVVGLISWLCEIPEKFQKLLYAVLVILVVVFLLGFLGLRF